MLKGKNILIGITGSIAAYKVAILVRGLTKLEANVKIVMTKDATEFITPLTLSTLSNNPVLIDWKDSQDNWNNHVDIGLWADLFIIAPATANSLAKMNTGICDNLLMAVYLSAKCPIAFAPAMDLDMFIHFTTQKNIADLVSHGLHLIDAQEGELASGLIGKGRMAEPETIIDFTTSFFNISEKKKLDNKNVLITAGPTFENIDPVRFIGNSSSGKMGLELALEACLLGANTTLIIGPNNLSIPNLSNLNIIQIRSAEEMFAAVKENYKSMDYGIFSAAVADYRPKAQSKEKIKKKDDSMKLELVKNPDILKFVGEHKENFNYKLIGFALETTNEEENAKSKLKNKNLDFIILNSLRDKGAGFSGDTNKVLIIDNHNKITRFELKSKALVAKDILKTITDEK